MRSLLLERLAFEERPRRRCEIDEHGRVWADRMRSVRIRVIRYGMRIGVCIATKIFRVVLGRYKIAASFGSDVRVQRMQAKGTGDTDILATVKSNSDKSRSGSAGEWVGHGEFTCPCSSLNLCP
jgi:hypothetical protein